MRLVKTAEKFKLSKIEAETLILSDSNVNTLTIDSTETMKTNRDRQTAQVANLLSKSILQEGYIVANSSPTHQTSVIDHIFTTDIMKLINITTVETHLSDHKMVMAQRLSKQPARKPRFTTTRAYNEIDYLEMCQQINQDQRLYRAMMSNDSDFIAQQIIQTVKEQLDLRAPKRRIQVRNKTIPSSLETKNLITQRNTSWNEYQTNKTQDNYRGYKNLKNQVKKSLVEDKKKMEDAVSSKDQWKEAKMLVGWTSYAGPQLLIKNGKPITSPPEMANTLNIDYIVRAAKAAKNTPKQVQDPMIKYMEMIGDRKLNLALQPLGRIEVAQAMDAINPSKSSAGDEISMRLLKKLKIPLLPVIHHLVNTTIITTIYPKSLKQTKIVPLLKKGKDQTQTKSYRGVNLIPALAKVIDKSILSQLLKHMEINQLVPHQHHGGISSLGTATALTTLVDTWSQNMERGIDSVALIMDQLLVYDLVDHAILLKKLQAIGLDKHSLQLMQSYLEDRTQSVQVETFISPPLNSGPRSVIQGSALLCVLYLIFTLDLPLIFNVDSIRVEHEETTQKLRSITYIDDNFVLVEANSGMNLQQSLDNANLKIANYMANNMLQLNPDKTQLMVLAKKPSTNGN